MPCDLTLNGTIVLDNGLKLNEIISKIMKEKKEDKESKIDRIIQATKTLIPQNYFDHLREGKENDPDKFITKKDLLFNFEEDYEANWVCKWTDKVSSKIKYILFANDSEIQQGSEKLKYEMAHYIS